MGRPGLTFDGDGPLRSEEAVARALTLVCRVGIACCGEKKLFFHTQSNEFGSPIRFPQYRIYVHETKH